MRNITELDSIAKYYQGLYKEAGTFKDFTGGVRDVVGAGSTMLNALAKYVALPTLLGLPLTAATAGAAASAISSPKAIAENADKYVLRSALDAEIAVMERKIADELTRRAKPTDKPYDRFV